MTELELSGFHPYLRDVIAVAIDLGWTARQETARGRSRSGTVILRSYDNTANMACTPVRQVNEAKLRTMRNKVVKYADPLKRMAALAKIEWAEEHGANYSQQVSQALPSVVTSVAEGVVRVPNPTVTTERPWLARKTASKRGGKVYESPGVTERVWSDGSTDYVCSFPECGWSNERPRSVANHYGAQHTAKNEEPPAKKQSPTYPAGDYFEPITHRAYRPQQRLIDALSEWLLGRVSGDTTHDELAVLMLTWAHERPDLPDVEPESRGPLTPEQILEAVRELVGAPLASRLVEAERAGEVMVQTIANMEAEVLARDALIERLRDERRTLADLLAEEQS